MLGLRDGVCRPCGRQQRRPPAPPANGEQEKSSVAPQPLRGVRCPLLSAALCHQVLPNKHTPENVTTTGSTHFWVLQSRSGYSRGRQAVMCECNKPSRPKQCQLSGTDAALSTLAMSAPATPSGRLPVLAVCALYCCSGPALTRAVVAPGTRGRGQATASPKQRRLLLLSAPHAILHGFGQSGIGLSSSVSLLQLYGGAVLTCGRAGQSRERSRSQAPALPLPSRAGSLEAVA